MVPVPPSSPWPRSARVLATLVLVPYLAAVVVAPLAAPPPASDLANRAIQPFRPLLGALHLGHGYRFFAPDPGPGHSLRWTARLPDGTERSGSIPDAAADRPRLLYHRRFMVAEKLAALVPPTDAPAEIRDRARADWLPLAKCVAGHLLDVHGATQVTIDVVEYYLPTPEEVVRGERGADLVTPLGSFARRPGAMP